MVLNWMVLVFLSFYFDNFHIGFKWGVDFTPTLIEYPFVNENFFKKQR